MARMLDSLAYYKVALIKYGIRSTYKCVCNLMLYYGKDVR